MSLTQRFDDGLYVRSRSVDSPRGRILYVHGLGESGLGFERLLDHPRLGGWEQLALDLPGYGKSPWPATPLPLVELADNLAGWLARAGIGPVVVVGHSMGGVVGQRLCERHRSRVAAFVNVEGNISPIDCTLSAIAAGQPRDEFISSGHAELCARLYRQGIDDQALRSYYPSLRICDPAAYHLNASELVDLSADERLAAELGALELPVVYLYGRPRGTGERSLALLAAAGVEAEAIEPAGHWPFIDREEGFVDRLLAFLDRLSVTD